jgi:hypothetical protein
LIFLKAVGGARLTCEVVVERFVGRQNIEHYRAMLKIATDPDQRRVLEKFLLEAQAKLKKDEEGHQRNLSAHQTEPGRLEDRGVARRPKGRA